jgi:non-ribosomal peptide synthase protein (TIGR01720 family)
VHTSYRRWAQALRRAAADPALTAELRHWRETLRTPDPLIGSRPLDPALDMAGAQRTYATTVGPDVVEPLLTDSLVAHHAGADDVLLTALAIAVGRWRGRRGHRESAVLVELERHGRDESMVPGGDLSRTVGWFTSTVPVALDPGRAAITGAASPVEAFGRVKEQLRAIPGSGIGHDLLRHLNADTAPVLAELPLPQIMFNYLGRLRAAEVADGDWSLDTELTAAFGTGIDPDMPAPRTLEVTPVAQQLTTGLSLTATWTWAPGVLSDADVRELAADWQRALVELRDHL